MKQFSARCATIPKALAKLCFQHAYLAIDALGECAERMSLLDLIGEIVAWKLDGLHTLATSRKGRDIGDRLEHLVSDSINIQSAVIEDMEIYVRETLQTDPKFMEKKWLVEVEEEINRTLLEGADGM